MEGQVTPLRVSPRLPAAIERLRDLASNLWFSWSPSARSLLARLDPELWLRTENNPQLFLRCLDQGILDRAARDPAYIRDYRRVLAEFDAYLEPAPAGSSGNDRAHAGRAVSESACGAFAGGGRGGDDLIAYFCAEYGFHESFPIYSGGLGILAGDHCKTASDLRLPFVAVGLLYRQGYFRQRIDRLGRQFADYVDHDPQDSPVCPAVDPAGNPIVVDCGFPGRAVLAKVWRAEVGRVSLLLLDTNLPENAGDDRDITKLLYGGGRELRLRQEAVLGIGGVRALRAAALSPTIWHINEGHAALSILERLRENVQSGLDPDVALEAIAANTLFTTHTPVAAGHDVFNAELVAEHFRDLMPQLGITREQLLGLGRYTAGDKEFNMTRLALRGASAVNGVSKIHGKVSSELCASHWPDIRPLANPVGYITNGVHVPTFIRQVWVDLFNECLGPDWQQHLCDRGMAERIMEIPDERFWYANQQNKRQVLHALRSRLTRQWTRNGVSEAHTRRLLKYLDPDHPDVLTVGFARRFATYKRATLLFNDLSTLEALLADDDRPILFVFSGKAHPADEPGQWMMREIQRISSQPPFVGRILLVEGYDIGMGRLLTSGVDVWLNTPVHPFEASGTSGMKAALNGTANLSVLDGWWAEGYDGTNGWAIPPSPEDAGVEERDRQDAATLYEILQDEVLPLYYERDPRQGFSQGWVRMCKRAIVTSLPNFNSERVVRDYARIFYGPAGQRGRRLSADNHAAARNLADWKARVRSAWTGVAMRRIGESPRDIDFDDSIGLEVEVELNGLEPEDIRVECVLSRQLASGLPAEDHGYADTPRAREGIVRIGGRTISIETFSPTASATDGVCRYRLKLRPPWAGALTYEIRAVPRHPDLAHPYEVGLMRWL